MPEPVDAKIECPNCGRMLAACICKYVVTCDACQATRSSAFTRPEEALLAFREHHEPSHAGYLTVREK